MPAHADVASSLGQIIIFCQAAKLLDPSESRREAKLILNGETCLSVRIVGLYGKNQNTLYDC